MDRLIFFVWKNKNQSRILLSIVSRGLHLHYICSTYISLFKKKKKKGKESIVGSKRVETSNYINDSDPIT